MTKTNKKNMYLLILVAVSITVIAVSFAYFVAQSSSPANTSVNVGTEVSEKLIFTPGDELSISANQENFAEGNGSISDSTTSSATIIANSSVGSASGVYQVYLDITANNFIYTVNESTPELILTVTNPEGNEVTTIDGLSYKTVTDASTGEIITGFDITTFEGLIKIKEDEAISTTNSSAGTTENWTIKVTFINLATDQVLNEGKTLESNFILQEEKIRTGSEFITHLHGGVDGTNNLYYTNNAEYRYSGGNPNNYVWFNEELWRIIGVFDEASHGITDTNLVKIIKDDSIGNYMFNNKGGKWSYGSSAWSENTGVAELNELLNSYYYNNATAYNNLAGCNGVDYVDLQLSSCDFSNKGIKELSKGMIKEVIWYLGGTTSASYSPISAYQYERGSVGSGAPGAHLTWTGNVGLLYSSDYGYATIPSNWNRLLFYYDNYSTYTNNWLYEGNDQWTITPITGKYIYNLMGIEKEGDIYLTGSFKGMNVKPTLYLKEEVKITSGTGTESDPYLLEM